MLRALTPEPDRHLPLPGTYNVRDIGGYRSRDGRTIQWRTFWRADSLHRLPPEAQVTLLGYGVRTVIDLRRSDELQAAPNVFAGSTSVTYCHLSLQVDAPLVPGTPQRLVGAYCHMLDERQEQICETLRVLAAPGGLPAVVHCTAGKDRTGLIAALVLGLAGVPEDTIVEDYALSARYLAGPYLEEARQRALRRGYTWEQYEPLVRCPPEFMHATLQYLKERYGSIEAYTRTIGLGQEQISRFQDLLLA
jgi:protein-tyrosine phosphatase